ncbi:TlpA family protein disulfide reductase [Brevundimonas aveniformis]|uniref:TlpA family protein disulfide reductase n=1 Tax=Brevundimonas aveniformis TaxID=370977 RepID=UPI0024914E2B|nr:TlpA disulfide reductase family protein [Brevundimonas aveniformis]
MDDEARRKRRLIWTIVAAVAVGALIIIGGHALVIYAVYKQRFELVQVEDAVSADDGATGSLEALLTPADALPAPTQGFLTPDGGATDVSDFRGRVVLLNIWAMWCRPCRTELPTLAALDQAYGDEVAVVVVNVDRTPEEIEAARAFLTEQAPLGFYSDPTFELPFRLPGRGAMPQTVLIDREGRIRAWLAGEADWNSPEVRALVDEALAEGG